MGNCIISLLVYARVTVTNTTKNLRVRLSTTSSSLFQHASNVLPSLWYDNARLWRYALMSLM